ncbi:MAG TPA: DUF2272 domain-containing protein [Burkholderiaceae bacterium]|nr:DUF2272 domain-containing protein [Burkholderiaceae bacterium]
MSHLARPEPLPAVAAGATLNRRLTVLLVGVAALAAGCGLLRPQPPAPLTASAEVPPRFAVPTTRERMVALALQEWSLFGSPRAHFSVDGSIALQFSPATRATHELQPPMLARVFVYWYGTSRVPIVGRAGELRPWSAAFVSWLVRAAVLGGDVFPATLLHWDYIERFLDARADDLFATRDPAGHPPRVGDLVCNARDDGRPAWLGRVEGFGQLRRGPYHCEIVVATQPGSIDTIGGNVGDVVAMTRLATDAHGRLLPHPQRRWAAVLELRDPADSPSWIP